MQSNIDVIFDSILFDDSEKDIIALIEMLFRRCIDYPNQACIQFRQRFLSDERFKKTRLFVNYYKTLVRERLVEIIYNEWCGCNEWWGLLYRVDITTCHVPEIVIFAKTLSECYSDLLEKNVECKTLVENTANSFYVILYKSIREFSDIQYFKLHLVKHFVKNYGCVIEDELNRELVDAEIDEQLVSLCAPRKRCVDEITAIWKRVPFYGHYYNYVEEMITNFDDEIEMLKFIFRTFKFNNFPVEELNVHSSFFSQVWFPKICRCFPKIANLISIYYNLSADFHESNGSKSKMYTSPLLVHLAYCCKIIYGDKDSIYFDNDVKLLVEKFLANFDTNEILFKIPKISTGRFNRTKFNRSSN